MNKSLTLFLAILPATVLTLTCAVCEFKLLPPHDSECNGSCEGDVCFIVVNKYFNGTINAGCMHLREDDSFEDRAICHRGTYDNRCACSTFDNCNNPNVSISNYTFTESPVLENYQWVPQIQPPMPSIQPILPPKDIPIGGDLNETVTELENGVEDDLEKELDERTNATQILRNEENDDLLTVTTSVGLNIRDHTNRINTSSANNTSTSQQNVVVETSTTGTSFTPGHGSVEVTKVTQEASPPKLNPSNRNLTTDGTQNRDPNSTGSWKLFIVALIPILLKNLL
ncbi:Activin_recp domain-containing protein [Caenorhabditis elegans]|uniref:Activin_recp domain-containing protein n=1 Tax=Caenorhabditis elegans TaxID=6239 RepID=Q22217_CAEEL|nr:Activin_recp domain-containing protein [Caenorhabditis elegans]CCD61742.1 Activin_recp domain-containing protein [Caenorhabditis elegans]|eukprot:NP_494791.1 Uncharacterized protein CELE_T05C1.1 [Caenorhabditis elegans]